MHLCTSIYHLKLMKTTTHSTPKNPIPTTKRPLVEALGFSEGLHVELQLQHGGVDPCGLRWRLEPGDVHGLDAQPKP